MARLHLFILLLALTALGQVSSDYFQSYHSHQDINKFLDGLGTDYSDNCKTIELGTSRQGRSIKGDDFHQPFIRLKTDFDDTI